MVSSQIATPPSRQSLRRRRARRVGLGVSAALHLILFGLFFLSARGAMVSGGAGQTEPTPPAIWISLEGAPGAARSAATPSQDQLDLLLRRVMAEQASALPQQDHPAVHASLSQLMAELQREQAARDPAEGGAGEGGAGKVDRGGAADAGAAQAQPARTGAPRSPAQASGPGAAASSGALWGQVEPCWRKLPGVSALPVSLEVTLTAKGIIGAPPHVLRPSDATPDTPRLIAEARAIAALTACTPYHGAGKRDPVAGVYRVDFQPG